MSALAKYAPPALTLLPLKYQGKTRDTFEAKWPEANDKRRPPLLIVATNRISTHNIVHKSEIPKKGEVLTALTIFWLIDVLERAGVAHHLITYGKKIYDYVPKPDLDLKEVPLHRRAIVVKQLDITLVEFILRQYLCGSLWDKYYSKGEDPYEVQIPPGLPLMTNFSGVAKFAGPVFTPTEKSETDPPLPSGATARKYPKAVVLSRGVFNLGQQHLRAKGIEGIDTKFEFGLDEDGQVVLADEVLTPDSSRFARLADIKQGQNPPWLDKQIARDKAEAIWKERGGEREGLEFSPLIISNLTHAYVDLFEMIVGKKLSQFQLERLDN